MISPSDLAARMRALLGARALRMFRSRVDLSVLGPLETRTFACVPSVDGVADNAVVSATPLASANGASWLVDVDEVVGRAVREGERFAVAVRNRSAVHVRVAVGVAVELADGRMAALVLVPEMSTDGD